MGVLRVCQNLPVVHRFCGSCLLACQDLPVVHMFCGGCFEALSK